MASKKEKDEAFNEEFNRVDQELKKLQLELSDLHQHHDDMVQKLAAKEIELAEKDEILIVIKERNKMELSQLEMEANGVKEKVQHEVNFHTCEVANLKHRKLRLFELRAENDRLQSTVKYLEDNINNERRSHALQLHEMNRSLKDHRQHMESKLRKELNGLDISFQKDAFCALHDKQKRAMFQNAKLKDEVAVQGIGISNLNTRLAKQKILYENTALELDKLHRKSEKIKRRVGDVTTKKNKLIAWTEQISREINELKVKRKAFIQEVRQFITFLDESDQLSAKETISSRSTMSMSSSVRASQANNKESREEILQRLAFEYSELKFHFRQHVIELELWQKREKLIKEIDPELQPTNQNEKKGIYETKSFPLYPLMKEIRQCRELLIDKIDGDDDRTEQASDAPSLDKTPSVQEMIKGSGRTDDHWFDLIKFLEEDHELASALQPIKGKENNIMVACNKASHHHDSAEAGAVFAESKDQNMIAWVTLRLLQSWYKAAWEATFRNQKLSASKSMDPTSSTAYLPTLELDEVDSDEDFEPEGKQLEDELDALWQDVEEENEQQHRSAMLASSTVNTIQTVSETNDFPSMATMDWLKKIDDPTPLMSLVANELQSSLFRTSHSAPSGDDVGPPVVMRSSLHYKSPTKSEIEDVVESKLDLKEFFDTTDLNTKKVLGTNTGHIRSATLSPQLSELRDNDPFRNKKRGNMMKTMRAHLQNIQSQTQNSFVEVPIGKSVSAGAIRVGQHLARTIDVNRNNSTGQLRKQAALGHSSHL